MQEGVRSVYAKVPGSSAAEQTSERPERCAASGVREEAASRKGSGAPKANAQGSLILRPDRTACRSATFERRSAVRLDHRQSLIHLVVRAFDLGELGRLAVGKIGRFAGIFAQIVELILPAIHHEQLVVAEDEPASQRVV